MQIEERTRRRDARFRVPVGIGSIEFDAGIGWRKEALVDISPCGLSFEWSGDQKSGLDPDRTLGRVVVRIGDHEIAGDLAIRGPRHAGAPPGYGGLFYPDSLSDAQTWERALKGLGVFRGMPAADGETT